MSIETLIGLGIGATTTIVVVVFVWRIMSWGRADNQRAGRWEVDCRTAWGERDTLKSALTAEKEAHAVTRGHLATLGDAFNKLAAQAIVAASDADAVRLAGGDGPIGNGLLPPDFKADGS